MKSDIRKTLALFLCLLLLFSFIACGNSDTTGISENAAGQNSYSEETETQAEDSADNKLYTSYLTPEDFSGEEFRIYTSNSINGLKLVTTLNYGEEETGEVVNDALVARDRWRGDIQG